MVKEAVFSMIQFEIEGAQVLDLFSGSGQMGIEALSRGARGCTFVDNAKAAFMAATANIEHTGFAREARCVRADVLTWLRAERGQYDIAFLDPPYGQKLLDLALPLTASLMRDSGVILCEAARGETLPDTAGRFEKRREYRYGKTIIARYAAKAVDA
jgi:16S rRNA (guanine(966)-N(2))-methyltransferase RsmD